MHNVFQLFSIIIFSFLEIFYISALIFSNSYAAELLYVEKDGLKLISFVIHMQSVEFSLLLLQCCREVLPGGFMPQALCGSGRGV